MIVCNLHTCTGISWTNCKPSMFDERHFGIPVDYPDCPTKLIDPLRSWRYLLTFLTSLTFLSFWAYFARRVNRNELILNRSKSTFVKSAHLTSHDTLFFDYFRLNYQLVINRIHRLSYRCSIFLPKDCNLAGSHNILINHR